MKTKMQKIIITPTAKNIEKQYRYLVKKVGYLLPKTRFLLYYETYFNLNDNEYKNELSLKQLEALKNKKMIKIKIQEVII